MPEKHAFIDALGVSGHRSAYRPARGNIATSTTPKPACPQQTRSESILDVIDGPSGPRALRIVKVQLLGLSMLDGSASMDVPAWHGS